jgi:hypothetical protein
MQRNAGAGISAALALLLVHPHALPARADGLTTEDSPRRNYGNFRIGGSTGTQNGRPDMCLELSPVDRIAIEGCGTGSGLLHHDPEREMGHYAVKVRLTRWNQGSSWFSPRLSVGFTELQIGADDAGFNFSGTSANGMETSGAEVGASVQGVIGVSAGWEIVMELRATLAYLPYAQDLVRPMDVWEPGLGLSFGLGF